MADSKTNTRIYKINDLVNDQFIRFPMAFLANTAYRNISLEAKLIYSLLLNRLTLSQRNNWYNARGEVYLIFTRLEASELLNITYKKTIAAFRELIAASLLMEERQGRGYPNLLYVMKTEIQEEEAEQFNNVFEPKEIPSDKRDMPDGHILNCQNGSSEPGISAVLPQASLQTCQNSSSGPAENTVQDLPEQHTSKTDRIQTDLSETDIIPSSCPSARAEAERTEMEELEGIYEQSELEIYSKDIQILFRSAIDRLYYSQNMKIGNAVYPQEKVRSYLRLLDGEAVAEAFQTMKANEEKIKNTTAYAASVLFNAIARVKSDLLLLLPPECLEGDMCYAP